MAAENRKAVIIGLKPKPGHANSDPVRPKFCRVEPPESYPVFLSKFGLTAINKERDNLQQEEPARHYEGPALISCSAGTSH